MNKLYEFNKLNMSITLNLPDAYKVDLNSNYLYVPTYNLQTIFL